MEQLNVSGIPALRIRTPSGELIASRDGAMPAEELVAWLKRHYEEASATPDDVLLATGEPDAVAVARLVRQMAARNAAVREAAARRLLPYPAAARAEVVDAFAKGRLATRLTALELLQQWRAPLAEMDPWQPDTIKTGQLAVLQQWAEKAGAEAIRPQQPSPQRLAAAAGDIDRMLKADDTEAAAIRRAAGRAGNGPAAAGHCPAASRPPPIRIASGSWPSAIGWSPRLAGAALAGRPGAAGGHRLPRGGSTPPKSWPAWPRPPSSRCWSSCSATPIRWCARSACAACKISAAKRPPPLWCGC